MAVLVTGCAGFIGSHLCEALLTRQEPVIGVDCLTDYYDPSWKRKNLSACLSHAKFQWIHGDLNRLDLPPLLESVDCVFHLAAQPGVRGSWGRSFDLYLQNNVLATQRLLEAVKEVRRDLKVVFSSSSSIYGNPDLLPTPETALPRPYSPYGTTKLAAEQLCMLYHANYHIPAVALRYFTVYGPRQRPDMAFYLFFAAIRAGRPIRLLGDGSQTRDFTYVQDIVAANLAAANNAVEGEVINIGGGARRSMKEVIGLFAQITGKEPAVEYLPVHQGDVKDTWADISKLKQLLQISPQTSLEVGLQHQWEWQQALQPEDSA